MFKTLRKIANDKVVLHRIMFTLLILVIYELGTLLPLPTVDINQSQKVINSIPMLQVAGLMSGGAFKKFSLLALGISPYITTSIVIQFLQMDIVPKLTEWSKEGELGRRKINKVTRYISIPVAFLQGFAFSYGINAISGGQIVASGSPILDHTYIAFMFTVGTMITLWLADKITLRGIGNGSSIIIVMGIISGIPSLVSNGVTEFTKLHGTQLEEYALNAVLVGLGALFILFLTVAFYLAIREVPVRYANKQTYSVATEKSVLPIKLNSAGVIPVIFALTIVTTPMTIASFFMKTNSFAAGVYQVFNMNSWTGMIIYVIFIYLFSFFFVLVQVSPKNISKNIYRSNGFIPGVRPGKDTEKHLKAIFLRLTFFGATYLALIALLPIILGTVFHLPSQFKIGGTGLLIIIGVVIETWKKVDAKINSKSYDAFNDKVLVKEDN